MPWKTCKNSSRMELILAITAKREHNKRKDWKWMKIEGERKGSRPTQLLFVSEHEQRQIWRKY